MHTDRLTHSFKTALAVLLGFLFTRFIPLPSDQWVIITILVVMCAQVFVGGVLQKSLLRFFGTVGGCLFGVFFLVTAGTNPVMIGAALVISAFFFSYISASQENLAYAGTLGAVTVPIILLGQHPSVFLAASRFLEISLGLLIATVVSQFVLPINARTHLKRAQVSTLQQLTAYYREAIVIAADIDREERDELIAKSLLKQRQLAKDSVREPLGKRFNPERFAEILYSEREILRAITFMHLARTHLVNHSAFQDANLLAFHESVITALTGLANALQNKPAPQPFTLPSITTLQQHWQTLARTPNDALYLDGYLFNAEILASNVGRLVALQGNQKAIVK